MVHFEGVDAPVSFIESRRGVAYVSRAVRGASTGAVDAASPVAAEGQVEHDLHVGEQGRVTAREREIGRGRGPAVRVGRARLDIRWNTGPVEEPNLDAGRGSPAGCVHAAVLVVEALAVARGRGRRDAAPQVGRIVGHVAVLMARGRAGLRASHVFHRASARRVERHGVRGLQVHAFNDLQKKKSMKLFLLLHAWIGDDERTYINLTTVGPVGTDKPDGRPGSASKRHVLQIKDEEAGIVGRLG